MGDRTKLFLIRAGMVVSAIVVIVSFIGMVIDIVFQIMERQ